MKKKLLHRLFAISMCACLSVSTVVMPVLAEETKTESSTQTESTAKEEVKTYKATLVLGDKTTEIKSLAITQGDKKITYEYKELSTDKKGVLSLYLPANKDNEKTKVTVNDLAYSGKVKTEGDNELKKVDTEVEKDSETTKKAETTEAVVTEAPPTEVPVTEAPTTEVPTTEAPTTEAPVTEAPATEAPQTESQPENRNPVGSQITAPAITFDYEKHTLSIGVDANSKAMYQDPAGTWKEATGLLSIDDAWYGTNMKFRAEDKTDSSKVMEIEKQIPARQEAPTGFKVTGVTDKDALDGAIDGITTTMVWSLDKTVWQAGTGAAIENLAAGTYYVQTSATKDAFASKIATVEVKLKTEEAVLEVTIPEMKAMTYGDKVSVYPITIKNTTDGTAEITKVELKGQTDAFVLNKTDKMTLDGNKTDKTTYTIQAADKVAAGEHKAEVIVTYHNGKDEVEVKGNVSLTVNKKGLTLLNVTAENRVYNKTTDVTVKAEGLEGIVGTDDVALKNTTMKSKMKDSDAGNGKAVADVVFELKGAAAGNYKLTQKSGIKVDIAKAENNKKPVKPNVNSYTYEKIEIKVIKGQEYSIDAGANWMTDLVFEKLEGNTTYRILTRYAEQKNYKAGSVEAYVDQKTLRDPIIADAANNKITGIPANPNYKTNSKITFTAEGAGMTNGTPSLDDTRYVPTQWSAYTKGVWSKAPYSAEFIIDKAGSYTLKVTYTEQTYNGKEWVNTGKTDTRNVSLKITAASITTIKPNTSSTNKNGNKVTSVKTGDETNVLPIVLVLGVSGIVLIGAFLFKKKKKEK